MAYVTIDQVAQECRIQGGFTAETLPSSTKVAEIMAEEEAKVDAKIGMKYSVPVAAAASLLIVRRISLALIAERVREIIEVRGAGDKTDQKPGTSSADRARKELSDIEDGDLPLTGETLLSSTDGVRSYAVAHSKEPVFEKGKDQW